MRDPAAMAPLENGRDDTVSKTEEATDVCTNGGSSRTTSVITNGYAEKERAKLEAQEKIDDALENSLLQCSDLSDSENLNLELELSDEEGVASATESTASTIVLSSNREQEDKTEATSAAENVDDAAPITSQEDAKVPDDTKKTVFEDSIDLADEDTGSSQDCIVVDESEPIVDSKSSAIAPSDAVTHSVSKQEDVFSTEDVSSNAKEAHSVAEGGDKIVVRSGDDDVEKDIEVIELGDSSSAEKDPLEEDDGSPLSQTEVMATTESEIAVADTVVRKEAEIADTTDSDSAKPEIQVIDIDDSSSESSKEAVESGKAERDLVPQTEGVEILGDSDGDASKVVPSSVEVKEEEEDKETTANEVPKRALDDVTEDSNGDVAISDELPQNNEVIDNGAVENDDPSEETISLKNTSSDVVKLEPEESIRNVDTLALEKGSSDPDNLRSKKNVKPVVMLAAEKDSSVANNLSSDLVVPAFKSDTLNSECAVNTLLSEDVENAVNNVEVEDADASTLEIALETPAVSTSISTIPDSEVVDNDEQKVAPTFTAADIVALTLETLLNDAVNLSERIGLPTEEPAKSEGDCPDLTAHEVFEIGDDSNESNSLSNESVAKSEDAINKKLSVDSSRTDATAGGSDVKSETVSDLNPVTPKPKKENITTSEEPQKRPKRSTVLKAEEALAKKMKLNNGGEAFPNSSRGISKENQNPAQKRGSMSAANDEAKKARIESLRQRKPKVPEMSNLDKSIARVASGGKASLREQEIIKLVDELSSRTLKNITVKQLEDLVQYKIGRFILDNSDCSTSRRELAQMRQDVEKWRTVAKCMAKQVRDLENVMKKMLNDMKMINKDALPIPAKVNRSVGLQVGDGRITNEQKKLAIPRPPLPTPAQPPQNVARRGGILTNRPGPGLMTSIHLESTDTTGTTTSFKDKVAGVAAAEVNGSQLASSPPVLGTIQQGVPVKRVLPTRTPMVIPAVPTVPSIVHRPSGTLPLASTPPKHSTSSPPAQTVVAAGLARRSMTAVSPRTHQGPLIDLTDGDETPAPRQTITAVPIRQMIPSKVRVITPTNTAPNTAPTLQNSVAVAKQQGTIRLVAQNTLTGPPSTRMAYMVPASVAGGEPRMYFATSAPKQQMNGGTVISRPTVVQAGKVVFSTNVAQMSPALRGLQPGSRQNTTFIAATRPAPGSVVRARPVHTERRVLHPAPLPPSPMWPNPLPGWKKPPPIPELKISKCDKRSRSGGDSGIILSWKMDSLCADNDEIKSYQLYAYQETNAEPSTNMWKKVGEVTAMALPMACTLTQFTEGNKYHFAVRAVDIRGRTGPFSRPGNILLSPSYDN